VEQLVKTLAVSVEPVALDMSTNKIQVEMRTARQQAEELEQAGSFLSSMLTPATDPPKVPSHARDPSQTKHSNGRSKSLKVDHVAHRFADPPAPPPQQPLPEKPDATKPSPVSTSFTNLLHRSDTAKQPKDLSQSPTHHQHSQMLSLIEALSVAKKELDSQGARVKQLEDMLKQERAAREQAEEKARKLEQHAAFRPVREIEETTGSPLGSETGRAVQGDTGGQIEAAEESSSVEQQLEKNLESVVADMQKLKDDVERYQKRAEVAEADASSARASLAEMIQKLRDENGEAGTGEMESHLSRSEKGGTTTTGPELEEDRSTSTDALTKTLSHSNGHIRSPQLSEHLQRAVANVLQEKHRDPDGISQSAPYVSMLGVVLIGVGLMAYLNSWQKVDK
jgi:hypothetical protein